MTFLRNLGCRWALPFIATGALCTWTTTALAQSLAAFQADSHGSLNPAWRVSGLPDNKFPLTTFELTTAPDEPALRLRTDRSYGVLTHAWRGKASPELAWRWQLIQGLPLADITTKANDDAALKVCVMFDQPLADIPFMQRAALSLARTATGQDLPSATLCYLWDTRYPAGTRGANPYSARVRYIVLNGSETATGQWVNQRRHLAEDFASLFGAESTVLPPVLAVAVGADSDNTGGTSTADLARLRWLD